MYKVGDTQKLAHCITKISRIKVAMLESCLIYMLLKVHDKEVVYFEEDSGIEGSW